MASPSAGAETEGDREVSEQAHIGRISIHRVHGGGECDVVRIEIEDGASGLLLVRAELSLEELATAITGQGHRPCTLVAWPRNVERMGWTREIKHEVVPRPPRGATPGDIDAILAPYEADGWIGDRYDITNHYCWVGDNQVLVSFKRFVQPTDGGEK